MSLFVVVLKNTRTGAEYLYDGPAEGYTEYADAEKDVRAESETAASDGVFELYVGKVVPADGE
jgi:hypothetical protein